LVFKSEPLKKGVIINGSFEPIYDESEVESIVQHLKNIKN